MATSAAGAPESPHHRSFWLWVMCLTGVDYFSTLGYQPSIAFNAAGLLAPLATVVLVLMTLCCALPVYLHVAKQSPHGQGSIAMLRRLVAGWVGKLLVLALVGFAATDYVITKTLSAADAAAHLVHNPFCAGWPEWARSQLGVTMFLLALLGAMFLRGFKEVIGIAVALVGVYLVLNSVIVYWGFDFLRRHPERLSEWWRHVVEGNWRIENVPLQGRGGLWAAVGASLLMFPKLALGLSGFETGVAVMPLVKGDPGDTEEAPTGRIRNTRRLLAMAAGIMSFFLVATALLTATLIEPEALRDRKKAAHPSAETGVANERALAYLAHGQADQRLGEPLSPWFGQTFGTIYDVSTILILWFAGASAMAGLLNMVPKYLPQYGMAPEWTRALRPLVALFTAVNLLVTWLFDADVDAQGGAYATGVLVLICSACVATVIDKLRPGRGPWIGRLPWRYVLIAAAFLYTTVSVMVEKPEGLKIAAWFIAAIVLVSIVSRIARSTELRIAGFRFADEQSHFLWDSMKALEFPVLVPHRPGHRSLQEKEAAIRADHHLPPETQVVFIEVSLGDASDFYNTPELEIHDEGGRVILRARKCASTPHTLAGLALELCNAAKPPEIHFGWSDESPLAVSASFLLWGEGNVPWRVRELLRKAQPDPARQPRVIVG